MNTQFYAFGEMLWDCLPSGRHAGGAAFNVCAHLGQLGVTASLISAVGQDALGDELLQVAQDKGINTHAVSRARAGLSTGTVVVTLDTNANATYEIVEPVAWDEIIVTPDILVAARHAQALVFGSLASRSPQNMAQLERLLDLPGPVKFFDVNLRAPYADPVRVLRLAGRADIVKLNDDEVGMLAGWAETGKPIPKDASTLEGAAHACAVLARAVGTPRICVTRGGQGAVLWDNGTVISADAPPVKVRDTVGAGDAFMAGLMVGLTRGTDPQVLLERACRLGAFVASHDGATPTLPGELIRDFAA